MAYAVVADIRALDSNTFAVSKFTDAQIQEAIDYATETIDAYCQTSFEYKSFSVKVRRANYSGYIQIPVFGVQSITGATDYNGTIDTTNWTVDEFDRINLGSVSYTSNTYSSGFVYGPAWNSGPDAYGTQGLFTITGTAGSYATAPVSIQIACRQIATQYLNNQNSAVSPNTIGYNNEFGNVIFAQPGANKPTSLPEVNAILNRFKRDIPSVCW